MTSVFIFDIASQEWTEQAVTSLNGTSDEPSERDPNSSDLLPRRRMSACTVVGSSKDKTSHNIVVLGGQNEVTALADTWVLSLPR